MERVARRLLPSPHRSTRFHFPTGLASDAPYGSDAGPAHALYVAGFTNFDLAHDNGLVYALDLDKMAIGGGSLLLDALAFDAGWDGTPLQVPDLDAGDYWDPENGVVITDSMAGEMRLTTTSQGGGRLFMASRYSNLVTAMDVAGASVSCYGGGTNCTNDVAATPLLIETSPGANQLLDVFGISNEIVTASGERDVFITHLRDQAYGSGGVTSTSAYGNNFSAAGEAYVIRQNVDQPNCRLAEPVGSVGTSASVALTQDDLIYTLFTGRYGGVGNARLQGAHAAQRGLPAAGRRADPDRSRDPHAVQRRPERCRRGQRRPRDPAEYQCRPGLCGGAQPRFAVVVLRISGEPIALGGS